ncbi:MAG: hypothetical protein HKN09_14070 [Saprospiraceae bacterium]|nr:hypothetical protein [Saprospiraceae bacterium]
MIYYVTDFIVSIGSIKRIIKRDFKKLEQMIKVYTDGLIPWDVEELKLLSAKPIAKIKRRSNYSTSKGYLSTIYQEPIFAFGIRKYHKSGRMIMLAKSDSENFKFHFDNDHTKVYRSNEYLGYITSDDRYMANKSELTARIERENAHKYATIYAGDTDIAHLNLNDHDGKPISERAFSVFHGFDEENADSLIILSLYHILFKPNLNL